MTTLSSRLGLKKHTTADSFLVQDYADNWQKLDEYPGILTCTSTTRPSTWGTAHKGLLISETDTNLLWRWDGTGFIRQGPTGLLARITRTTDFSTSSTSLVTVLTNTLTTPAGNRTLQITAEGSGVYNTVGVTRLALYRGATQLHTWLHQGKVGSGYADQPRPLSFTTFDSPTTGSVTYTLRVSAEVGFGGTSTLTGGVNDPLALTVVEA